MNEIVTHVLHPSIPLKNKITYLNSALVCQSFRAHLDYLKVLIEKISELIVSSNRRWEGLTLLENALQQCPDLYAESKWCSPLITTIKTEESPVCKELACKCLILIVTNLSRNAPCELNTRNPLIPAIIREVLNKVEDTDAWLFQAIKLVAVCMKKFPSAVYPVKEEVQDFLYKLMDCLQVDVVDAVAECYVELPACSARSMNPESYRQLWHFHTLRLISTLHEILNMFFNFYETGSSNTNYDIDEENVLPLPMPADEVLSHLMTKAQHFQTLCKCLAKMFSTYSRFVVSVPMTPTINLLSRLFVLPDDVNLPRNEDQIGAITVFPMMQNAGLIVFEALILNFHTELIKSAPYVINLMKELFQASKCNPLSRHQLNQLRCASWKILDTWILQLGFKGALPIAQNRSIIEEILAEISIRDLPMESKASLKSEKFPIDMYSIDTPTGYWAVKSCGEAIQVLKDLFYTSSPYFDQNLLEKLAGSILLILSKIQHVKEFPFPYSNAKNRKKLYELLSAMIVSEGPHRTFVVRSSVGIFNTGLKDPSIQVVGVCQQAIALYKNILHPKKPSLKGIEQPTGQNTKLDDDRWHKAAWDAQCSWLPDNPSHQDMPTIAESIQVTAAFHNSNETEVHKKDYMPMETFPSSYVEHSNVNQVNGESITEYEQWGASQSEEESGEEILDDKSCEVLTDNVTVETKSLYNYSETMVQPMDTMQNSLNEKSNVEKVEYEELQIVENTRSAKLIHNTSDENICQNGVLTLSDEEMPGPSREKRVSENGECSVDSSEESSEGEEGEGAEEEYDETDSVEDSPMKKIRLSNEDMESEDENSVQQSDAIPDQEPGDQAEAESECQTDVPEILESEPVERSPTVKEMCDSFVLCEANDIS